MANFFLDNKDLQYQLRHPLMRKIVELKERGFEDKDKFDYAPVDFEDAMENYEKVLEIVGGICGDVLAPNAESVDHEGPHVVDDHVVYAEGTQRNHQALIDAGVYGIALPRQYGGLNFPMVPYVMTCDLISRADAGFANIWGLQDCAETLNEFASEEQKQEFLTQIQYGKTCAMDLTEPDAGSDLQKVMLRATWDEEKGTWLLNGVKRFITNGDGDISLVLARSEEGTTDGRGLSMFVYDRKHMAVKVRRIENKLGIKGSPTCELVFTNAPAQLVGSRKMGLIKYVMSLMNSARLGIGAQSAGVCEAAYREALKYAHEREQFGHPIIEFPAMYEMLTNMKAKVYATRALLYETTRFVDIYKAYSHISNERKLTPEEKDEMKQYQKLADGYTPLLKLMSSEYSNSLAYDSLQIHGGSGFMKDYPIERIFRDARITTIYEGTSQLQVVAAIKGVTTGLYAAQMEEYEKSAPKAEMQHLMDTLIQMREQYQQAVDAVQGLNDGKLLDFHARRLVEMAGHIIMGHLLLHQASEVEEYVISAETYIKEGKTLNTARWEYIRDFKPEQINMFEHIKGEFNA
ncbi:MAG: acyl-CoA dehydrogenase family protein [Rikenellaceae bacterium]|jgi:alkylation response protein AidB-like acyl-CoA dehydrogenase|nr:acyl-CoA dehydrogenase family protein [Rikenellaceae bacterium]